MNVEASTTIARSPAEVFAFVGDVRNEPQWHTDILETSLTGGGSIGMGSTFEVRIKPSMGVSGGTGEVLEYRPNEKIVFHWRTGRIESVVTHTVTPDGAGTRFTRSISLTFPPAMRLATPLIRPMIRKAQTGFLANLQRVLEA